MDEQKPGEVVSPGVTQSSPQQSEFASQPAQPQPVVQPEFPQAETFETHSPQAGATQLTPEEYPTDDAAAAAMPPVVTGEQQGYQQDEGVLRWQTAEGGSGHEKSGSWFLVIVVACVVLAGGVYFLTRDFVSVGAILIGVIALLYLMARRPGVQDYALSEEGVYVGQKLYDYSNYKGFSVNEDAGQAVIMFTPLKRFMPPLIIHVDPQMSETVVNALSTVLPHEDRKPDAVDSLMRRMRF